MSRTVPENCLGVLLLKSGNDMSTFRQARIISWCTNVSPCFNERTLLIASSSGHHAALMNKLSCEGVTGNFFCKYDSVRKEADVFNRFSHFSTMVRIPTLILPT